VTCGESSRGVGGGMGGCWGVRVMKLGGWYVRRVGMFERVWLVWGFGGFVRCW
jgi:hypothetical protein